MTFRDKKDAITTTVRCEDAVRMYLPHLDIGSDHRVQCPIHNGTDRNMELYSDGFQCYVCGIGGTVIDLVAAIFDIPYKDAMEKINDDFHLCIPMGERYTLKDREAFKSRYSDAVELMRAAKEKENKEREEWWRLEREYAFLYRMGQQTKDFQLKSMCLARMEMIEFALNNESWKKGGIGK